MNITVYQNFKKKINSTKQPSGGRSVSVRLKESCSIINPVFILQGYDLDDNYVKWGNRYYYIDNINIVHNDIAEYSCTTDVLATFKSDIGASSEYVTRSSTAFNTNVMDTIYPTLANPTTQQELLTVINRDIGLNTEGGYVLGVIGKGGTGVNYYKMSQNDMTRLLDYMFGGVWLDGEADLSVSLQKELINPFQYVVSCMWFPFIDAGGGHFDEISFGYWDNTGCTGGLIDTPQKRTFSTADSIHIPPHPQAASRGAYLNGSPYTRVTLEAFCFGTIPIDVSHLVGDNSLTVRIAVDLYTGLAELRVTNRGHLICKQNAQLGVPIQISQITQPVLAPAMQVVGVVGNIAAHNYAGAIQGVGDTITSSMPQMQTSGTNGSNIAFNRGASVTIQHFNIADEDNEHIGRPLCAKRQIASLGGYIRCNDADLDTSANSAEKAEIISYMNGGFYYE